MPEGGILDGLTASIGIATYPAHGGTLDQLLGAADRAMYSAKHEGRDRALSATPTSGARIIALPRRRPPRPNAPHIVSGG
jgi:predicted signal transduction protein with EAL and GGDEF domain